MKTLQERSEPGRAPGLFDPKKIIAPFRNAGIFIKLMAAGLTTISVIVLMSLFIMLHFFDILNHAERVHALSDSITTGLLQTRLAEKNFVRYDLHKAGFYQTGTARFLSDHNRHIGRLRKDISTLMTLSCRSCRRNVSALMALLDAYDAVFKQMVAAYRKKGFRDWGLLGQWRSAIHGAERRVAEMNRPDLQESLLQLRRLEKDYLLRGDPAYIRQMNRRLRDIQARVLQTGGTDSDRVMLEIERYESLFRAYLQMEQTIGKTDQSGLHLELTRVIGKIKPLIDQILTETRQEKLKARENFISISVAVYLLGFVIAGSLFYGFSRSFSTRLGELKKAALTVGRGELNTRLNMAASDEIGIVARAFNQMTDALDRMTVSKNYVDKIIETMADMLIVVSPEMIIKTVNRTTVALLGYSHQELLGRPSHAIVQDPEFGSRFWRELLEKDTINNVETTCMRKDGRKLPVLFSASVMYDPNGKRVGIVCVAQDITERQRAEKLLKRSESQLRLLSSKILEAQENERKRVARELHDGIGQALTGIKYCLENGLRKLYAQGHIAPVRELEETIGLLQSTVDETRKISMGLRPSTLDDIGIAETVFWFCEQFKEIYKDICVETRIEVDESCLPDSMKTAVFRVIQEALNNTAKHSRASHVTVELLQMDESLRLSVTDNGAGFSMQGQAAEKDVSVGLGLAGMKERTELSGGRFSLISEPGRGTAVDAVWPIAAA